MKKISVSRQYAPLRVCADICFYFYTISLFSFSVLYTASDEQGVYGVVTNLIAPWSLQLAVLVAACLVLGFVIIRIDNMALRFLLSLLPGLSFLMSPFQLILLIHAAAWIYYVIILTIGNFEIHLDVYRRRIRVMLLAALLLTLCLIIFHFGTDDWYSKKLFGGEMYGLLFFVLAVLSLRGMRLSLGASKKMRILDGTYVVVLPVLLVAAFFLLRFTVPAITFLFSLLSRFLIWVSQTFFPGKRMPDIFHPLEEEDVNKVLKEEGSLSLPYGNDQSPDAELVGSGAPARFHVSIPVVLCIMIAFLAGALILVAIRQASIRQKNQKKPRLVGERMERVPFEGLLRHRSGDSGLPVHVRQIRRTYRTYLEHIRSLRMRISISDTSKDVLDHSSAYLDLPENERLRDLYIAARYGDPKKVTSDQAAEAKRCLSAIESAKPSAMDE